MDKPVPLHHLCFFSAVIFGFVLPYEALLPQPTLDASGQLWKFPSSPEDVFLFPSAFDEKFWPPFPLAIFPLWQLPPWIPTPAGAASKSKRLIQELNFDSNSLIRSTLHLFFDILELEKILLFFFL